MNPDDYFVIQYFRMYENIIVYDILSIKKIIIFHLLDCTLPCIGLPENDF